MPVFSLSHICSFKSHKTEGFYYPETATKCKSKAIALRNKRLHRFAVFTTILDMCPWYTIASYRLHSHNSEAIDTRNCRIVVFPERWQPCSDVVSCVFCCCCCYVYALRQWWVSSSCVGFEVMFPSLRRQIMTGNATKTEVAILDASLAYISTHGS